MEPKLNICILNCLCVKTTKIIKATFTMQSSVDLIQYKRHLYHYVNKTTLYCFREKRMEYY